ncbi:MAG: alpha-2-macroglobulin [Deltaproteobacteria bacterium]|nr:MAG: alpha-2-macroglobulin [Deltaproteobacteria bacterium]
MTRRPLPRLLLVPLLLLAVVAGATGGNELLDAMLSRPAAARGIVVVPDRFVRAWDPITVFFPSNTGKPGPEDTPERFVRMAPDQPGAWTWLDAQTLQFRPAEPWPPLQTVTVSTDGEIAELATLMSPPSASEPRNGASNLDRVESIGLTFPHPVPVEALARMITLDVTELSGQGVVTLDADDFEIKAMDRPSADAPARYALTLDRAIELGKRVTLRFGLALGDKGDAVSTLSFSTAEPFRATAVGCPSRTWPVTAEGTRYSADQPLSCRGKAELLVQFSASPGELDPVQARNLVRLDPAVPGLDIVKQGAGLAIRGEFDRDTLYEVTLTPALIEDHRGRALDIRGESTLYVRFEPQSAYLSWSQAGIVEAKGPKRIGLQGRGHGRVDLRIVPVEADNRNFWPLHTPIALDEEQRPAGPGEEPEPWTSPENAGRHDVSARIATLPITGWSRIVDLPLDPDGNAASFGLDVESALTELSGKQKPGHYLVGVRTLDGSTSRAWHRIQVTDLALSTIESADRTRFVVTSLSTAAPVSGATVYLEGSRRKHGETTREWAVLSTHVTGPDGTVDYTAPGSNDASWRLLRIRVVKGDDQLVLDPSQPPEHFADNLWRSSGEGWMQWMYGGLSHRGESSELLGHAFPERPIYRPGETVYLKAFLRERFQGHLKPLGGEATVVVRAPNGKETRIQTTLSAMGAVDATFVPEEDGPTGHYSVQVFRKGGGNAWTNFLVEAYRLPTFEVDLHGDGTVPLDKPFDVRMTATYYAGGRVAERPVRWRVTQYPYAWNPDPIEGFVYSTDSRFASQSRFRASPDVVRSVLTDAAGESVIDLDPSLEPTAQPRTYVVEATVTGADDQTVTSTTRVHAVPAFALGLKAPRVVEKAKRFSAEVVAVGPDGKPIADQELTVRLVQRQWHSHLQASDFTEGSARYVTDVVDETLETRTLTSGAAPESLSFDVPAAGVYLVEVEAQDALGRGQLVTVDLFVAGEEPVSWDRPKAGVFEVTADKGLYEPGDEATLLVQSPYQSARALIIVETPTGNRYEWVNVKGGKARFKLPIETGWVPRLPVHTVLYRGRKDNAPRTGNMDLGKPVTVANTTWLKVAPVENQIDVRVELPDQALPGEEVPVTVRLADPRGNPLSGEVTLWLVDRAVLALGEEQRLDPLPDFIRDRRSRLLVHDTRNLTVGAIPYAEMPGGDGAESEDRMAAESALDAATVRRNFQPVPYYEPTLKVGASGKVTVNVKLPDNLTVFAVRAKAISGPERFGVGTADIRVRLPLVAQPALPRFVRAGDAFVATAIGRVVEGPGGAGSAEIRAEGLDVQGEPTRAVSWSTVTAERIGFDVRTPTPAYGEDGRMEREDVEIAMGVRRDADGAADAFALTLPLLPDRERKVVRESHELTAGESLTIEALPEPARDGTVQRLVVISDEPALVRMVAAADFLRLAPVGSAEQRISRARAYLALSRARTDAALRASQEELDAVVRDTLAFLPEVVDGGNRISQWPGYSGSVALTAWSVHFLIEAREAGYAIDEALLSQLAGTLRAALRSDYSHFIDGEKWMERTLALEALTATGTVEDAYLSELARNARYLDHEALASIALAAHRAGRSGQAVATSMGKELESGIITRLYEGREVYGGLTQRLDYRSPLILPSETRTLAKMARAIGRTDADSKRLDLVIDALVTLGREDGWGNTHANAAALFALAERIERADGPGGSVEITSEGDKRSASLSKDEPVLVRSFTSTESIDIRAKSGGPLLVLVTSRYVPAAPGAEAAPEASGFVVHREARPLTAQGTLGDLVDLGDGGVKIGLSTGGIVEEHVQIVVPEKRHYVAVEVPFAAGVELLNPALATAPPEARPSKGDTARPAYTARLDDRVVYFFETLDKGTWDFYVRTRATAEGSFSQPPATARMLYSPDIRGQSAGARIDVAAAP